MSKSELRFGGNIPFRDPHTGQSIDVAVYGAFVGEGIEAHEQQALQSWILNALRESAAAYDGNVYELPQQAGEWGSYVSMQLAPQIAQQFHAHGQVQVHSVTIGGAPMAAKNVGAPMAAKNVGGPMAKNLGGEKPMAGSPADVLATAFVQRLGMQPSLAQNAAALALEVLSSHGVSAPMPSKDEYYAKQQAYEQKHAYDQGVPAPMPSKDEHYAKQKAYEQQHAGVSAPSKDDYAKQKAYDQKHSYDKGAPDWDKKK